MIEAENNLANRSRIDCGDQDRSDQVTRNTSAGTQLVATFRSRLPVLIFDFGNVVAFFDYARAFHVLGQPLGISGEALLERARSRNLNAILQQFERGIIAASEFSRAVCELAEIELTHEDFAAAWSNIFWLNEPVAQLVGCLKKQGYTLILGSNTNDLHARQFQSQFASTLANFDRLVLSHEVGYLKPSVEFYRACTTAAGADPDSCLFIDDMAENVDGARRAGLSAIQFSSVSKLLEDLRAAKVDVISFTPSTELSNE